MATKNAIFTLAVILGALVVAPVSAWAEDDLGQRLADVQGHAQAVSSPAQLLRGVDLPHSLGKSTSVQRVFENGNGALRVKYPDGESWTVSEPITQDRESQFASDPVQGTFAFVSNQSVVLADSRKKATVACPLPESVFDPQLSRVGKDYILFSGGKSSDSKAEALDIFVMDNSKAGCKFKKLSTVFNNDNWATKVFDFNGRVGVLFTPPSPRPFSEAGSVGLVAIDLNGREVMRRVFPGYNISSVLGREESWSHASGSKGLLVPLVDLKDKGKRINLYRISTGGSPELLARGGIQGAWIGEDKIVVNRGVHANSSELVLLSGDGLSKETVLPQPTGFKSNVLVEGEHIQFTNDTRNGPRLGYRADPLGGAAPVELPLRSKVSLGKAAMPVLQRVTYASGDHRVASVLSLPPEGCGPGGKKPVLVYLHGGSYSSVPTGDKLGFELDRTSLLFSQLGWPVLEANYYGDEYLGGEFDKGADRVFERDRYAKTLQDIQAAGEFAKSLPCADPNRIILMGHSHGAIITALYATAPEYANKTPFARFIIKNGLMGEKDIRQFHGLPPMPEQSPAAVADSACVLKQDRFEPASSMVAIQSQLLENLLNDVVPIRRVKNIIQRPVLFINGHDGGLEGAREFERALKANSKQAQSWFPEGPDEENAHEFSGKVQIEFVKKVKSFVE